ncbi:MAG: hypoxanthine phosphoribosyltransferase [Maricaulis sp.]|jgi:hypoxanthine phosphoribosyltransferase|nr:hypoxanthine phosphoribosyltransferase [Maricaulis sp.]HAQ34859.1 hypoxanthine phosphoribosyltransferase [Alphaproteobacteria bacterium]
MITQKRFISAQDLLEDSFALAKQILESGFKPTHIVGVWRGGAPTGIAVQEYLAWKDADTDHIAVRTSSYRGIDDADPEVRIHGLGYFVEQLDAADRVLIVDDVFDSGRSAVALEKALIERCSGHEPAEIRIATVWFKPDRNQTNRRPDFYVRETSDWLVFPHELCGLSPSEIAAHKPGLLTDG